MRNSTIKNNLIRQQSINKTSKYFYLIIINIESCNQIQIEEKRERKQLQTENSELPAQEFTYFFDGKERKKQLFSQKRKAL